MKKIITSIILLLSLNILFGEITGLPNVKLKDFNKKRIAMNTLAKDGPILINFWTMACEPCKKEMKYLNKFNNKYEEYGFQVYSINMDTPRSMSKVKSYIKSTGYNFTVLSDPRSESFRKLGAKAMPLILLVNKDGNIYKRHTGYNPGDEIGLEKEIKELIIHNYPKTVFEAKVESK
jgi:peroxiredoxin